MTTDEHTECRDQLAALRQEMEQRMHERTAALEDTVRELNTFAYTVAHDLRAPLRAMQGFGQILLNEHADALNEEGKELALRIREAGQRMDALIQGLLAYSRLSREEVTLEPISLDDIVGDVLRCMRTELDAQNAQVEVRKPLPPVRGNVVMLTHALSNLIANAVKFVEPGQRPQVRVSAEIRDEVVRVSVKDTGIGIAPQHHPKLFRVFEKLHGGGPYAGTGIGLAIVRRAIERMDGQVGVESVPGRGSTFWFELPALAPDLIERSPAT